MPMRGPCGVPWPGQQGARSRVGSRGTSRPARDSDPGTAGRVALDTGLVLPSPPAPPARVAPVAYVVAALALVPVVACLPLDVVNDAADRDRAMMGWGTISAVVVSPSSAAVIASCRWRSISSASGSDSTW